MDSILKNRSKRCFFCNPNKFRVSKACCACVCMCVCVAYMLPGQHILRRVSAGYGPQMASALRRLYALAKVRIDREIVPHRVLPAIIVRLVVRKAIAASIRERQAYSRQSRKSERERREMFCRLALALLERLVRYVNVLNTYI